MLQTRRSLARALLLGAASAPFGAMFRPGAMAQGLPVVAVPDFRAQLRYARAAMPPANLRGRYAVDRTLERLDDLGVDFSAGRLILVNIAAAELIAYDMGREVLRSRVVVGANKTRTPQLATFVTSARCNPPWYVPASIEPEVRATGAVGFRVVNGRLIQPPGPTNPLGPIRIGLLDSDGIFLHGTNSPAAFARQSRAVSHGCVRVERIRDLAAWMTDRPSPAIQATLDTGRTIELIPTQEVQVALGYLTVWPDSRGRLVLHGDPYGLDVPGARRAPYRRIPRPLPQAPDEAEAVARAEKPEDNPL
ncbi:L,D-transpeptidase family protein [Roseomonas chloroacetimidivorans]|uniref:L,D-transpeptidase family protein n=1 Tax=Roseomonas chloroacetimidivorans TaxID=1766656 RepID=UPI003C71515F